ncbi:MAG TPA: sensor domain-containing protein [Candidatus Dormibacteraeota bacterium]|nr:sensor domain-containing protein [Candidatus Dormibacteraeota bacterium]
MIDRAWQLTTDGRTYLRILYLLLAFPLGIIYFTVLVTGMSVGFSLAIVFIGLPILVLTLLGWLLFARIERELAINLLGAAVRPMTVPDPTPRTLWQRLLVMLGDPVTWKSLVYVLLEFPFGIFSFTLVVTLLSVSVTLVFYPVVYIVLNSLYPQFPTAMQGTMWPGVTINGHVDTAIVTNFLLVSAVGVALLVGSLALLNGIGWLWGRFAEVMLGVDESKLHLAAAKAEAEEQHARADQADRSRRELIVNASHELRTPVASISAHVESLLKPGRDIDEETRRYLSVVATETDRLSSLVDDVMSLARADADELHLDMRAVDVAGVVDQVCETLAPLARRERTLSLVHTAAPGTRAMADRDRLAQVLTNLIRNSLNHTPDGGIISVEAAPVADRVVITVSDTGVGMEPSDLARIFDRFYRADPSRARDKGGSGLGLAIVRDLLAAMGGTIAAESTPGQGSVFRVSLPREAS